jgi:TonB family protein
MTFPRTLLTRLVVLSLLAAPHERAAAQAGASIAGVVRDSTGRPIADVEVGVLGAGTRVRTDAAGSYRVLNLMPGRASVFARRLGFVADQRVVRLTEGEQRRVDFVLATRAQTLDPERVVAKPEVYESRLAGFNERRTRQVGHFVTRERIERANSATLVDVLREIPGMRISPMSGDMRYVRIRSSTCPPLVFIDGVPASAGEFDLDMIDLKTVEGIEVYAGLGSLPPEFSGPRDLDRCGVIAIWSRPSRSNARRKETAAPAVDVAAGDALVEPFGSDQVDVPARPDSGALTPSYPDSLFRAGATGRVVAEFVVDTSGRVEAGSVDLFDRSDLRFADAVRATLARAHFRPAMRGGRAVRQSMQVPFVFVMPTPATGPSPAPPAASPPGM